MVQQLSSQQLKCGIARADITPPVGIKSAGFAVRGPLTKLHDPLFATAVVFDLGSQRIAMINCDLLGLDADTVKEIRAEIYHRTQLPIQAITVSCTHTHYGPDPYRAVEDPLVMAYRANLIHILAGVVKEAVGQLQPVTMRLGWGNSDIGINRREKLPDGRVILGQNPDGAIDRAVGVMRIDTLDKEPLACLVNFQTHPVSQASLTDHISADFPGKMREVVETVTKSKCLFFQGASGNINSVRMELGYEPARSLGVRLGCEVVRVWEICGNPDTEIMCSDKIGVASTVIDLPRTRYGSKQNASDLVASLEAEIQELNQQEGTEGSLKWAKLRLSHAKQALESWSTSVPRDPIQAEVQVLHIGDFALATAPGEIFNQIGVQVKEESPFAHTWFLSCTNGSIGYVPIPEAYADGGYEVTHASQVSPEAAGMLTQSCLDLLREIYQGYAKK